ncbi:MAG: chalcone isomerase family protein [Gammaproteobacteria bacterium]
MNHILRLTAAPRPVRVAFDGPRTKHGISPTGPRQAIRRALTRLALAVSMTTGVTGWSSAALAQVEIAGVKVPGEARVGGKSLLLNGAGLRSRFFVKVYVGALYLGTRTVDAVRAMQMRGPKRIAMHVVYDEIEEKKVRGAFEEGFENNTSDAEHAALKGKMNAFVALFPALERGDVALIDLIPGDGIHVTINGEKRGSVPGDELQPAVMGIWLGEDPADSDLKEGMLGQ